MHDARHVPLLFRADGKNKAVVAYALALLPVSLIPVWTGQVGVLYLVGAIVLGLMYLYAGARVASSRTNVLAKRLLFASVVYLPLVFALMMIDKVSV